MPHEPIVALAAVDPTRRALTRALAAAGIATAMGATAAALAMAPRPALAAPPATRAQALKDLDHVQAERRAAAVQRLAEIGLMADAPRVAVRLRDADPDVREQAGDALWMIWSRSGDAAIDRLFAQGVRQMNEGALREALATFGTIVERKPAFAEGWNKRATVLYLLGEDEASLKDCDEVLARNPGHFGALSGMAQIHLRRGDPERALAAYERALRANPNLDGGAQMLRHLEEAVRERRRRGT
jgi:tetratricopeptide (TPR) repeat protein